MAISSKAVGRNMRRVRLSKGMTQERAAERMGMSILHYGRIERGERTASLAQLDTFANQMNTTMDTLLSGSTMSMTEQNRREKELGETIEYFAAGCSPTAKEMMLDVCRVIAEIDKYHDN